MKAALLLPAMSASCLFFSCTQPKVPPAKQAAIVEEQASSTAQEEARPRLIVWLTVDQMRGDYLKKYEHHFGEGGFKWLREEGRHYSQAHYSHAITETAPGHATLFTGVSPREHGIVANDWLLQDGTQVASVTDEESPLLGPGAVEGSDTKSKGRSPHRLLAPTVADSLLEHSKGASRVVSISVKDRGAILPAGRGGKAYWLGKAGFVTSSYYHETAPSWLRANHEAHPPLSYVSAGWSLARDAKEYKNSASASPYAPSVWGPSFPHQLADPGRSTSALGLSPFGDSAVIDLALAATAGEKLGEDEIVDLLAVSLSSTDKIGHLYGPESKEFEDQIARLDAELARLFTGLSQFVPPERMLVVLSADHGGCESAEFLKKHGKPGHRLTERRLEAAAIASLKKRYGTDEFYLGVSSPYIYLRRDLIQSRGLDLGEIKGALSRDLASVKGVHLAYSIGTSLPPGELGQRIAAAIHPDRSGDLYIVPQRHTLFLQEEELGATHGSPWDYDTHVPIVLLGAGVSPGEESSHQEPRQLAATVARLAGITGDLQERRLLPLAP